MGNFCNKNVTLEAWYAVCKSKEVKPGQAIGLWCGGQDLLIRRFKNKKIMVSNRYCPHMGTDLVLSKERENETIQCAFHGLQFLKNGTCLFPPSDSRANYDLQTFPVEEKYGLVWAYLGKEPRYSLPELHLNKGRLFHSPSQKINAHHHIIICNGLDKVHTRFVHTFENNKYSLETNGIKVVARLSGIYRAWWMMLLNWSYSRSLNIEFTSYGPSVSVADVQWHKTRLVILFTARQDENGKCHTNTALYLDTWSPIAWARAICVVFAILKQDADILNSIHVRENFTPADDGVAAFRDVVNSMPIYSSHTQ